MLTPAAIETTARAIHAHDFPGESFDALPAELQQQLRALAIIELS